MTIRTTFPLGQIVATQNALDVLTQSDIDIALQRHALRDWGDDLCQEDYAANNQALLDGTRILSVYKSATGDAYWIITEADRSATTVLLPSDY